MKQIKVGDYVRCRGFMGIPIFAIVKDIKEEELEGTKIYTIEGPEGEYTLYSPELVSKKEAKEWIDKFQNNIKFLKNI